MDALEREIQADILREAKALGFRVWVTSQRRRTEATAGILDLYLQHTGAQVRAWAEIKTEAGPVTDEQRTFLLAEVAAGGIAEVWRSVYDFRAFAQRVGVLAAHGGPR